MSLPFIVLLDLDGTLIGDISPQICLYNLHNTLKKRDKNVVCFNDKQFQETIKSGVLRPHFQKFLKKMKKLIPETLFYIYTASEKQWANFIIKHIEKAMGMKFCRPIFTRNDCLIDKTGDVQKPISTVLSKICKDLKKKFPSQYGSLTENQLQNRWLMIDNTITVFDSKDVCRVINCPTYKYLMHENIPSHLNYTLFEAHKDLILQNIHFQEPFDLLHKTKRNDWISFNIAFYKWYTKQLMESRKQNLMQKYNDTFFMDLINIINHQNMHHHPTSQQCIDKVKYHVNRLSSQK